jgi:hypothetical protein
MKTITISEETYNLLQPIIERLEAKGPVSLLQKETSYQVSKTSGYFTKDCFKGKNIAYRDRDFDNYFTEEMPEVSDGPMTTYKWEGYLTFKQMAQAFLNTSEEDLEVLAKKLIEGNHTFSVKQIEELMNETDITETDKRVETGLLTNYWSNFFPIHDKQGNIFFANVSRDDDSRWGASVHRFDYGDEWYADDRVSFRN